MELTLVGLQYSGKTTFVNVIAVSRQNAFLEVELRIRLIGRVRALVSNPDPHSFQIFVIFFLSYSCKKAARKNQCKLSVKGGGGGGGDRCLRLST